MRKKRDAEGSPLAVSSGICFQSGIRTAVCFSFLPPSPVLPAHVLLGGPWNHLGSFTPENWVPGSDSQRVYPPGPGNGAGTASVKRRLENRPLRLGGPEDEREAEPLPADPGNTQQLARAGRRLGFLSRWDPRKGAGVPSLSPVLGWPGAVSLLAPVGSSEGEPGAGEGGHVSTPGDAGPLPPASGPGSLTRLLPGAPLPGRAPAGPLRPHRPPASTPASPGGAGPRGPHTVLGWPFSVPSVSPRTPKSFCSHSLKKGTGAQGTKRRFY